MTYLRILALALAACFASTGTSAQAQTDEDMLRGFLGVVSIIAALESQRQAEETGQPMVFAASTHAPPRSLRPLSRPWEPSRGLPLGAPEPRDPGDFNLPSTCLQHLPLDDQGRGIFLLAASCLASQQVATATLPGACLMRFDFVDAGRPVFSVPCLLDRGYVLGY